MMRKLTCATMMMCSEASPLATLCYKAGSTLDEVLALEEEELFELSKEIVGNTVLDHARVLKYVQCRTVVYLLSTTL
jgi:hypothetical protein